MHEAHVTPRLIADDYRAVPPLAAEQTNKSPALFGVVVVGAIVIPLALLAGFMPLLAGVPVAGAIVGILVGAAVIASYLWLAVARVRRRTKRGGGL